MYCDLSVNQSGISNVDVKKQLQWFLRRYPLNDVDKFADK